MENSSGWPLSGSFVLGLLCYGAVSIGITGQVVADRTLKLGGHLARCESAIRQGAMNEAPKAPAMPKIGCATFLGKAFCDAYKVPDIAGDLIRRKQAMLRHERDQFIARRIASSKKGCACGARLVKEKYRLQWGLLAGTLRISRPASVTDNLHREVIAAARSKLCS